MADEYTSGPWEMEHYGDGKDIFILNGLIKVDYDDVDQDEQLANARLITAAPDMLGTLVAVRSYLLATKNAASPIMAMIDKALIKAGQR